MSSSREMFSRRLALRIFLFDCQRRSLLSRGRMSVAEDVFHEKQVSFDGNYNVVD